MRKQTKQIFFVLVIGLTLGVQPFFPAGGPIAAAQAEDFCGVDPLVSGLLEQTSAQDWAGWIARLSGRDPVTLAGEQTTIQTRFSYAMFRGESHARGYEYVLTRLREWYPAGETAGTIEENRYSPSRGVVWKNIVLTLPGAELADEIVILSAHLDSTSDDAERRAPGAEDNASGSAALLEAARIFRGLHFERTIRLIWFTGEEQGLLGSKAYVEDHDLDGVVGVINLDMYGYDHNRDGCFELHIGTLPASAPVGACFQAAALAYSPTLKVDAIDRYNMRFSDHDSFWKKGIGAVEVLENFSSGSEADACGGLGEQTPYYHRTSDTLDKLNLETGFAITPAGLAGPQAACFAAAPRLEIVSEGGRARLTWSAVDGALRYRVYRAAEQPGAAAPLCSGEWLPVLETNSLAWTDSLSAQGTRAAYRVEAVAAGGACTSAPSACVPVGPAKR